MTDSTKTIYRSASQFFTGTLLSRMSGLARDIAMAFAFGTESSLATFMVAFRFAHLARRLFGEGSLQNIFIPHFEELRAASKEKAFAFFRDLSCSLTIALIGFIGLGIGVLTFLVSAFKWSANVQEILSLTAWMLPSLLFICLYGLNTAFLACEKSYFTAAFAPVAFNLVWIIAALTLPTQNAMVGLSIAVVIGCIAQWATTLPSTFCPLVGINPFSQEVKKFIKPLLLANFGVAASQINNALDPLFALFADAEGPALLWYAIRVQQLPLALFGIALSNALLPPISRAIKNGNYEQFHYFYSSAYRKVIAFTALITGGIFATAPTCINLLFGRGHFDLESVAGTAKCLLAYGFGLFPMTYVLITAPTLFAFSDYKTPARAAFYTMLLSISLNSLFIFVFNWSATSVALSTSLAAYWNAYYLSSRLKKHCHLPLKPPVYLKIAFVVLSALISVWTVDFFFLGQIPSLQILLGMPLTLSQTPLEQISLLSMEAVAFLGTSAFISYIIKAEDFIKN